jgi:hypothetical protein
MRILRFELLGRLKATHPGIKLESQDVRQQFHREMEGLITELTEAMRKRIAAYLPADYSIFVRMVLPPTGEATIVMVWVDDPTIRWPAGLLSRRAWKLSVPVLSHAISETFAERIQGVALSIDRRDARVSSYAPMRIWSDPLFGIFAAGSLVTLFWLYVFPLIVTKVASVPIPIPVQ